VAAYYHAAMIGPIVESKKKVVGIDSDNLITWDEIFETYAARVISAASA
jgi:hypothetical protein